MRFCGLAAQNGLRASQAVREMHVMVNWLVAYFSIGADLALGSILKKSVGVLLKMILRISSNV